MVRNTLVARFISASALALAAASLSFPQVVSALPLNSGGTSKFGFSHNNVEATVTFSGALWTTDPGARTVSLNASVATCTFKDLDIDRDGVIDSSPTETTAPCSLDFSIRIPNGGSRISCSSDVRTYSAYCDSAQFNLDDKGGMSGTLIATVDASTNKVILGHAGCSGIAQGIADDCSWDLGSLPEKNGSLDGSKFGCTRAFPAGSFSAGGANEVVLNAGQLLKYSESFAGGSGNCTTGTLVPAVEQGIRMCFGEAEAGSVTDCQRHGSGNNTLFHVLAQKNDTYRLIISRTGHIESNLQTSGCNNNGTTRFIVYGEDGFDVHQVDLESITARISTSAPLISSSFSDDDGDGRDDLVLRFGQCALGASTASGTDVTIEITGTAADGTLPWQAFVNITTN